LDQSRRQVEVTAIWPTGTVQTSRIRKVSVRALSRSGESR
jgi:hypothetical protein